ncbi:MAG: P-loop NTPase fold protein [Cyanobacteria bacterium J06623_4]
MDRQTQFAEAYRKLELFPLYSEAERKEFGVTYGARTLSRLQTMIVFSDERAKLVFTGHRGCGKSTLLASLSEQMRTRQGFYVLGFSIADMVEMSDINHVNILYSIAIRLLEKALDDGLISISKSEYEDLINWFSRTVTTTTDNETSGEVGLGVEFLGVAKVGLKNDRKFRKQIKDTLERRVSELSERITRIAKAIQKASSKEVLVIIDDLDKLDLATVKPIFQDNIKALFSPEIRIVFTIPIAVMREPRLLAAMESEGKTAMMSVTKFFPKDQAHDPDAVPDEKAIRVLEEALGKRIPDELIEPQTRRMIVLLSGGVLRELVRLAQECCQECMAQIVESPEQTDVRIDDEILKRAVNSLRNQFARPLGSELYKLLAQTYHNFNPPDARAPEFLELLHGLHVLEYENGDLWYDLHPLVADLLRQRQLI